MNRKVKLRVLLKRLKAAADAMERVAHKVGVPNFTAYGTRCQIRSLRIERPLKRRARKWTRKRFVS